MTSMTKETYPRASGKCKKHWIAKTEDFGLSEELYPTKNDLVITLAYLEEKEADLVKGDVVHFEAQSCCYHNSQAFYDGEKLIELSHVGECGGLPDVFHVIENNVPIKYWDDCLNSSIVYFDYALVKDQCLQNIQYGLVGTMYRIYTSFIYNKEEYKIMMHYTYEYDDDDVDELTEEIKNENVKLKLLQQFKNELSKNHTAFSHYIENSNDDYSLQIYEL